MRLLIGVDGSEGSLAAVQMAGRLLGPTDEVGLYYSPVDIPLRGEANISLEMRDRARQALSEAVYAESIKRLPAANQANVQRILGTQRASRGLPAAALEWRADAVCVGSRGYGPIKTLLVGSVAKAIVTSAQVPVLAVRPTKHAAGPSLNVLLAYDASNAAHQAAALTSFTWPGQSKGQVIAVIDALPAPLPPWLEQHARSADAEAMTQAWVHEHDKEKQELIGKLESLSAQLPKIFTGQQPIVAEGHAAEQILLAAERTNADLIVVGKSSRTLYQRVVLGSTSEAVLHHAPCSVLVVPLREAP